MDGRFDASLRAQGAGRASPFVHSKLGATIGRQQGKPLLHISTTAAHTTIPRPLCSRALYRRQISGDDLPGSGARPGPSTVFPNFISPSLWLTMKTQNSLTHKRGTTNTRLP